VSGLRWTPEQLAEFQGRTVEPIPGAADMVRRHKYQASPTVVDGFRFDSKLEARYYRGLVLRQRAGEVVGFLRQVPFHLPGRTRLVIDFLEFRRDGSAVFVDTKGVQTEAFRIKLRQVREIYPWARIEIVEKVDQIGAQVGPV
jgi:hypothetical protein